MLSAVHEPSGQLYLGWKAFEKFQDPHKENFICCPEHKLKVVPVIKHLRTIDGIKYVFGPFFRHLPDESFNHGEGEEHVQLKILINYLMGHNKVNLLVNDIPVSWDDLKIKTIDYEAQIGNRRADVLAEFEKIHPLLGRGVDFEVQLSTPTEKEIQERERDWIMSGWSLAWINTDMFIDDSGIECKDIVINRPYLFGTFHVIKIEREKLEQTKKDLNSILSEIDEKKTSILNQVTGEINDFKDTEFNKLREEVIKRVLNIDKWVTNTCRTCCHGGPNTDRQRQIINGQIACWWSRNMGISERPVIHEEFDTCKKYKRRGEQ